ncbi:MAG TPA: lysyl oxidase family protein [Kofleriaceae bacterium]|nr:lysyl oxidase family protein [Kofleriaceae bacterium]
MNKLSQWMKVAILVSAGSAAIGCEMPSEGDLLAVQLVGAKLPDIVVRESDLYDHVEDPNLEPGRVHLRLSNGTANIGTGKLHLYGVLPANADGTQDVMQRVFGQNGEFEDRLAGKFLFHEGHNHIHFVDWAAYRIRQILPGDGVGPIVAEGAKTSFCIIDLGVYNSGLPDYNPSGEFHSCSSTVQGLSVGWIDVYSKGLQGQSIDITGVPPGQYWLESEVDPLNHVLESDETNNITRIKVTLGGGVVDGYEPNNTRESVDARPEGGPNSPNLGPVNPERTIQNLSIDSPTDVDWFKFYVNHTGGAGDFVQIQFTSSSGDLDLELLNASGASVALSQGTGNSELISLSGRPEGWYYARVFGKNGALNASYQLTINPPQNGAPSVVVTSPPVGNVTRTHGLETYTVQWTASDPEADQTWVTVYVNTTPALNGSQIRLPTSLYTPGAQGFYVINSADFTPGTYWVYTEITDGGTTTGAWSPGTVSFTVVNDACASATPIFTGSTAFTTLYATTDGPAHAACNQFSNNQVGQDVWFRYQAECSGTVTFSTCGTATYDTKIAVYEQAGCDNLDARILGCVDDTTGCGTTSTVAIAATQGQQYLIRLGGYASGQGTGTLTITAPTCGPVCGNGVVEAGEECDGSAPSNQRCTAQCKLEFTKLVINEIYYDSPGADAGSFIEIAGPPSASLTGYRLKFVNGAGGTEYDAPLSLDGKTIGASGYFVVAQDGTVVVPAGTNSMISTKANMQNGPDSVQLVQGTTVIDAVAYGNFGTTNVPAGEGQPAGNPGGTVQSLARLPNGKDTENNAADFGFATRTPGAPN